MTVSPPPEAAAPDATGFRVTLTNFEGPFDLLLQLIGKHKLDVTEVSLHKVTDEFIAYIRAMGDDWDLDEVSEFLVIAATLLDLKAARLLPTAAVEDEDDLALLEARDLLFARLLQYKAYKEAAAVLSGLEGSGARRWPRSVALEARFAEALPELVLGIGPARLAALAEKAMRPKAAPPLVSVTHIHMVRVSVREHLAILREKLIALGTATFRHLCADCQSTLEVVARFLALLELYREDLVSFDQVQALGELTVKWTGTADASADIEVDEFEGSGAEPADAAANGDPAVGGDAAAGGDLAVGEGHGLGGDLVDGRDPAVGGYSELDGDPAVDGGSAVGGDSALGGDLARGADSAFDGDLTAEGALAVDGDPAVDGDLAVDGAVVGGPASGAGGEDAS